MLTGLADPCLKSAAAPTRSPAVPSRRILVVEDDRDLRKLNAIVLLRSGYQVDAAEDGEAGWAALHANHYDLLVTDNDMPRLSGLGLVKKLRSAHMALPVILAAATLPPEEPLWDRDPSLDLTATLLKPFPAARLVETVQEVLHASADAGVPGRAAGT